MSFANTHTFFCCELECNAEAHVFGGRCDECFEMYIAKLRTEHNPHQQLEEHHCNGYWDESLERYICEECLIIHNDHGEGYWDDSLERYVCPNCHVMNEHHCSGEFDYDLGCYICDDNDDPRCPGYKPTKKHCPDWYASVHKEKEVYEDDVSYHGSCWFDRQ